MYKQWTLLDKTELQMRTRQKVHPMYENGNVPNTCERGTCCSHDKPSIQISRCSNQDIFVQCHQNETQEEMLTKASREEHLNDHLSHPYSCCARKRKPKTLWKKTQPTLIRVREHQTVLKDLQGQHSKKSERNRRKLGNMPTA